MSVAVPGALAVTPLYRSAADAIVWWDDPGQTWSQRLASGSGSGTVTSISGGAGITVSPSPIVGSGTVSLTVPVSVANGGTGTATVMTAGSVVFAGAVGAYAQDNANLFWDDGANRLGIGTALPATTLDVNGTIRALAAPAPTSGAGVELLYIDATSGGAVQCYDRSGGAYRPIRMAGSVVQLGAAGNIDLHINASHNVGIGTTGQTAKLHVVGSVQSGGTSAGFIFENRANPTAAYYQMYGTSGQISLWHSVGGDWFLLRDSDWLSWNAKGPVGGIGAYVNLSDERGKTDIAPADVGLAEVLRIVPISYSRMPLKGDTALRPPEIGFSAQQVQTALPEAVSVMGVELPDGSGGLSDANPTLGVQAEAITAALVNAVKELAERVGQLEARL